MPRLHLYQATMEGQQRGGIRRTGQDNEGYDDVLNLDGCYFVYVCVGDPGRARDLEASKKAKRRRKERMGTVTL